MHGEYIFLKIQLKKKIADVEERLFDDHLRKFHRKPYERFSDDEDSY